MIPFLEPTGDVANVDRYYQLTGRDNNTCGIAAGPDSVTVDDLVAACATTTEVDGTSYGAGYAPCAKEDTVVVWNPGSPF